MDNPEPSEITLTYYVNPNKSSDQFSANPSKYPQKTFPPKQCRWCTKEFSPLAPSHLYCSDECADKAYDERLLRKNYGIGREDYERMLLEQNYKCKICDGPGFLMNPKTHRTKLVVDHCHETGIVRGLLCHNCNRALGLLKDSIKTMQRAISYLEGATTISKESTLK